MVIELIIKEHLENSTAITEPVYLDVPSGPPAARVVIERTGGSEVNHIRNAQIAIQCYGNRRESAVFLHERVMAVMKTLNTRNDVSACELNAEYDFTDTSTKEYRYQSVYNIVYYGGL